MKTNKPLVIIFLIAVILFLLILNVGISHRKKIFENFETSVTESSNESRDSQNLFESTYDFVDYSQNSDKLLDMFNALGEAEKKCESLERLQFQREERQEMRDNENIYKELQEQDKKIHELKEIVKYLTIEKKRREKINKSCMSNKQRKLNENYNLIKSLNKDGFLRDNSVELDLNISDSEQMKELLSSIRGGTNADFGTRAEAMNSNNSSNLNDDETGSLRCQSKGDGYVDIDSIGLDKCYNCDADSLRDVENYINRDFD